MAQTTKPALKHGGYSTTALLPGEDPAEFEKLHRELIAELEPSGSLEKDTVSTLARLVWRKQNLGTFRIAELARERYAKIESQLLPVVMPSLDFRDPAERDAAVRDAQALARKELGDFYELVEIGHTATLDQLIKDLAVEDRLDAIIDRCLKRLLFLRGLKSLSSTPQRKKLSPSD